MSDSIGRPVSGVTLTVVNGSSAGTATVSGDAGTFRFANPLPYPSTIKASRDGYVTQDRVFNLLGNPAAGTITFSLESSRASVNLTGRYSITFSADPACDLPELRPRIYTADITGTGSRYRVALQGGVFEPRFDFLSISVFEDVGVLEFRNMSEFGGIKETADENIHVELAGFGQGTVSREAFQLTWNGYYWYGPYGCPSHSHRVAFTRVG